MAIDDVTSPSSPPLSLFTFPGHCHAAHDFLLSLSLTCTPSARPPLFYPALLHPQPRVDVGEAVHFLRSIQLTSPHVEEPSYHLTALRRFYSQRTGQQPPREEGEKPPLSPQPPATATDEPPLRRSSPPPRSRPPSSGADEEVRLPLPSAFAPTALLSASSLPSSAFSDSPSPSSSPLPALPVASSSLPPSPLTFSSSQAPSPVRSAHAASPTASGWFIRALSAPNPALREEAALPSSSTSSASTSTASVALPASRRARHSMTLPPHFVLPGQSPHGAEASLPLSGSPSPTDGLPASLRRARTFAAGLTLSSSPAAMMAATASTQPSATASHLPTTSTVGGLSTSATSPPTMAAGGDEAAALTEALSSLSPSGGSGPPPSQVDGSAAAGLRSFLPLPSGFVSTPASLLPLPLSPHFVVAPAVAELSEQWEKDLVRLPPRTATWTATGDGWTDSSLPLLSCPQLLRGLVRGRLWFGSSKVRRGLSSVSSSHSAQRSRAEPLAGAYHCAAVRRSQGSIPLLSSVLPYVKQSTEEKVSAALCPSAFTRQSGTAVLSTGASPLPLCCPLQAAAAPSSVPFSSPAGSSRHLSSAPSSSSSSSSLLTPSVRSPDLSAALKPSRHGTSYSHLLPSSPSLPPPPSTAAAASTSATSGDSLAPIDGSSEPIALDDPNIQSGRHRVVLALPGLRSSIISFVRGKELKRELNEQFRLQHPWLQPSMSLSKLRRCKLLLLACGVEADLELSTVALAHVYLERLCWKNLVDKKNRKLLSAVCLTLAYKYNEGAQQQQRRRQYNQLFTAVERLLDVRRTDVLKHELC